jgi:hypothetical protein
MRKFANLKIRMSASAATLTTEEYEERRHFAEEVKLLTKTEMEEIFKILKELKAEFSENSNGVFFDVSKLPAEIFGRIQTFMAFSKKNRVELSVREEEYKKAQESLEATY